MKDFLEEIIEDLNYPRSRKSITKKIEEHIQAEEVRMLKIKLDLEKWRNRPQWVRDMEDMGRQ